MYERIHVAVDSVMPDFTLKDEFGKNLSLKKFKRDKEYVVLAIIRGVDDAHTRQQLDYLRNDYQRFQYFGGDVLAVSYGSVDFNRSLITNLSLPFHILSDSKCQLIEQLGLRNRYEKLVGPAIYLLNQAGTVMFMYQGKEPEDIVEDEEIILAMQGDTQSAPDWPVHW
jgi:thioredoxin-dependent peroxiredoxin